MGYSVCTSGRMVVPRPGRDDLLRSITEALGPGQLRNEAIGGEEDFSAAIYADQGRIIYCC